MRQSSLQAALPAKLIILTSLAMGLFGLAATARAAESPAAPALVPFTGDKVQWHGFDRYDFIMDDQTLAVTPFKAPAGEGTGVGSPARGHRRCVIVVPKEAAPGNPWSWQGCYWDYAPQTEIELLRRGFHIAYISADADLKPGKEWDAWYAYLTGQHGLSKKPNFIGMSRGGEYSYTWATSHPGEVSCLYVDNPGMNDPAFSRIADLARHDVPVLQICGSEDPILGKNATAIENIYQQFGGRISVMIKDGAGHHPHSLQHPELIADFITRSFQETPAPPPAFAGANSTKTHFYAIENIYSNFPSEGYYITCRGAIYTDCYDRYEFNIGGVVGAINIVAPKTAAPGTPWVFRTGFLYRDAKVDLALLAKGFHIVTGPIGWNENGPLLREYDAVYKHLTDRGFSSKPVMEGAGRAGGEACAWAIENPDKVSCVYGENPVLRATMSRTQPLDNLAPLAKAGVPILSVCGSLDPSFKDQTQVAEQRYKGLGGQFTVILKEGEGHYPLNPTDAKPVVEFIVKSISAKP